MLAKMIKVVNIAWVADYKKGKEAKVKHVRCVP